MTSSNRNLLLIQSKSVIMFMSHSTVAPGRLFIDKAEKKYTANAGFKEVLFHIPGKNTVPD